MVSKKLISTVAMLYVVLGFWRGYIALYDQGSSQPRQIFPQQAASLPVADQEALEKGIIVRNQRDLEQLLEDYLS